MSKLQEMVKDREAWHGAVHGVTKSQSKNIIAFSFSNLTYPRKSPRLPQWISDEESTCNAECRRHGFEWTLGDGEGQGSLAWCSPWGCKESDRAEQLN